MVSNGQHGSNKLKKPLQRCSSHMMKFGNVYTNEGGGASTVDHLTLDDREECCAVLAAT